jgi:hypothetical protein
MRLSPLIVAISLVSGVAASAAPPPERGEAKLAKILEGRVAGEPVQCVNSYEIQSSEIIDGTAIVYRAGRRLYVNRPEIGRETLRSNDVLVTRTVSSRLCSIDSVELYDRTSRIPRGFVGLGKFVPYTRPVPER